MWSCSILRRVTPHWPISRHLRSALFGVPRARLCLFLLFLAYNWVVNIEARLTQPSDFGQLILMLLCSAEFEEPIGLTDNWPLHRVVVFAADHHAADRLMPSVGHRPDPMVGRRVIGLDRALASLVHRKDLVRNASGWRCSARAAARTTAELNGLDPDELETLRDLALVWRGFLRRQLETREAHPTVGVVA